MEHADVEFSHNVIRSFTLGGAFAIHESRAGRGATKLRIADNDFEVPDPAEGLFLADFSASPALDLEVVDDRVEMKGTTYGAIDILFGAGARILRNTISGPGAFASGRADRRSMTSRP